MKLLVVFEDAGANYSAFVPDLPGCVSTGKTKEDVVNNIREAIALHLAGMREDGDPMPEPGETWAEIVEVSEEAIAPAEAAQAG